MSIYKNGYPDLQQVYPLGSLSQSISIITNPSNFTFLSTTVDRFILSTKNWTTFTRLSHCSGCLAELVPRIQFKYSLNIQSYGSPLISQICEHSGIFGGLGDVQNCKTNSNCQELKFEGPFGSILVVRIFGQIARLNIPISMAPL